MPCPAEESGDSPWTCPSTPSSASAFRPSIVERSRPPGRGCPGLTNSGHWSSLSIGAATTRVGRRSHRLCRADSRPAATAGAGRGGQPPADTRHRGLSATAAPSDAGRETGGHPRSSDRRAAHFRRRRRRRVPQRIRSCGVSIDERVARLTESIAVLRKLWSGETASHHGRFFSFEDVRMLPPPRQVDGPPIWCGGRSEPVLRRAGQ